MQIIVSSVGLLSPFFYFIVWIKLLFLTQMYSAVCLHATYSRKTVTRETIKGKSNVAYSLQFTAVLYVGYLKWNLHSQSKDLYVIMMSVRHLLLISSFLLLKMCGLKHFSQTLSWELRTRLANLVSSLATTRGQQWALAWGTSSLQGESCIWTCINKSLVRPRRTETSPYHTCAAEHIKLTSLHSSIKMMQMMAVSK